MASRSLESFAGKETHGPDGAAAVFGIEHAAILRYALKHGATRKEADGSPWVASAVHAGAALVYSIRVMGAYGAKTSPPAS